MKKSTSSHSQIVTSGDSLESADLGVSPAVAKKLIQLREVVARSNEMVVAEEAWHILYSIAGS
jgi:hypothetical protein